MAVQSTASESKQETGTNLNIKSQLSNTPEGVQDFGIADQPSNTDTLGFEPYVTAINNFLTDANTKGPLTLSVEGEWGSGKSSFMLQLANKLKEQNALTVEFNAWRHDKADALWAAFALKFVRDLSTKMSWFKRLVAKLKLRWHRFDWEQGWFNLLLFALGSVVFAYGTMQLLWHFHLVGFSEIIKLMKKDSEVQFGNLIFVTGGAGYLLLGFYVVKRLKDFFINPLTIDLKKYLDAPNYHGYSAFIEDFHRDFARIVEIYAAKDRKVFVFIDDLDRCEVPKAADLMQALNLMISDSPQLVFIMGMDREKIAAGLAVKYEKLIPYLSRSGSASTELSQSIPTRAYGLEYGYEFIEKFIQLPFQIPQPAPANVKKLLNSFSGELSQTTEDEIPVSRQRPDLVEIVSDKDSQTVRDIVLMVAPALDNNPRRIKQFLNLFRLKVHIASQTGLFAQPEAESKYDPLTLQRLGKFIAITLRWPLLMADLELDHTLLSQLQRVAWGTLQIPSDHPASRWVSKTRLIELLQKGFRDFPVGSTNVAKDPDPKEPNTLRYSLTNMDLRKLLEISPVTKRLDRKPSGPEEAAADNYPAASESPDGETYKEERERPQRSSQPHTRTQLR